MITGQGVVTSVEAADYSFKATKSIIPLLKKRRAIYRAWLRLRKRPRDYAEFAHICLAHGMRELNLDADTIAKNGEISSTQKQEQIQDRTQEHLNQVCLNLSELLRKEIPGMPTVLIWSLVSKQDAIDQGVVSEWRTRWSKGAAEAARAAGGKTGDEFTEGTDAYAKTANSPVALIRSRSSLQSHNREHLLGMWFAHSCKAMRVFTNEDESPNCFCIHYDLKRLSKKSIHDSRDIYFDPIDLGTRHTYYRSVACIPIRLKPFDDAPGALAGFLWIDSTEPFAFHGTLHTTSDRSEYSALAHLLHAAADTCAQALLVETIFVPDKTTPDNLSASHQEYKKFAQNMA